MSDIGLDTTRSEPACQPEPVPAGLVGDNNALDLVLFLLGVLTVD
jgi:hypothetical protein